jgi:anti-sigma factor RsiW
MNAEAANHACSQFETKLEDYLSGQLSGTDAMQVAEHLRICSACSAALEDATAGARLLRMMEPTADPGPAFARTSMARIRADLAASEEAKGFWQPFVSLAWRFAATVAVALAVMVSYDMVRRQQEPTEPIVASVQRAEVRDLFTTEADRVPQNRDDVLVMVAETENGKQ